MFSHGLIFIKIVVFWRIKRGGWGVVKTRKQAGWAEEPGRGFIYTPTEKLTIFASQTQQSLQISQKQAKIQNFRQFNLTKTPYLSELSTFAKIIKNPILQTKNQHFNLQLFHIVIHIDLQIVIHSKNNLKFTKLDHNSHIFIQNTLKITQKPSKTAQNSLDITKRIWYNKN